MSIHKVKDEFTLKASCAELFAALDGIVCAGVTVVKAGANTLKDPLAARGFDAAMELINGKERLGLEKTDPEITVASVLKFLRESCEVLGNNPDVRLSLPKGNTGGRVSDVLMHIEDILAREENASAVPRPETKFYNGNMRGKFNVPYLPRPGREEAQDAVDADMDDMPQDAPDAPKKRRGRGPRNQVVFKPAVL